MKAWSSLHLCHSRGVAVRVLFAALLLALLPAPLPAQTPPTVTKLLGRATQPQVDNLFGAAVAVSDRFLLVGELYNKDKAPDAGAAHLYDARTGRYLRKLTAKDAAANDLFGGSVALSGNLALIGAPQDDNNNGDTAGAAYVFDARTGKQLRKLTAADGAAFDQFGRGVALSGNLALIGAWGDDDNGSSSGSAYVFDARSGQQLHKLTATDGAALDVFGARVALSGHLALVGAHGKESAYVFNAHTGVQLHKLTADDGVADDVFGSSVALSGYLALVGAYGDDGFKGSAYLFNARTGVQLQKLTAADGAAGDFFGVSAALHGSLALIGASRDDDNGVDSGSAYFIRPLAVPLALARVTAKGAAAPGVANAPFNAFPQAFLNPDGEAVLLSTLSGSGAAGGRNRGVWDNLGGMLDLALLTRDDIGGGVRVAKITKAWSDNAGNALIQAALSGVGVNAGNNQALFRDNGATVIQMARTGTEPAGGIFGGAVPQSFPQVAQAGQDRAALNTRLKKGGAGGVTAANDSALFFVNHAGAPSGVVFREGISAVTGGGTLGQLFSRVAESRNSIFVGFGAAVIPAGGGPAAQAVFSPSHANAAPAPRAMQGADADSIGPPAVQNRAFLGETIASSGWLIWRASLRGAGVTSKNNEGLWHENGTPDPLIVRKGQEVDPVGLPGVKIARLLQFWPASGANQAVVLVRLSGAGVSGANDLALLLWNRTVPAPDTLQILLREGQFVEGADAPAIKVIQRVDVEPVTGHYTVLCSLTGAAGSNQALFTGRTTLGDATALKVLRLPVMKLRKGVMHTLPASTNTARLRRLILPVVTDAAGAGGKGLGQVINDDGKVIVTAEFDNKAREVLSEVP